MKIRKPLVILMVSVLLTTLGFLRTFIFLMVDMLETAKKPTSIDQYIAAQPVSVRTGLEKLRITIKKAAPKAEEVISYQMPGFRFHGILVWFAAANDHYGFYPFPKTIDAFKSKLVTYELSKGTIKFPLDKPIPVKLITEIVKFRVIENLKRKR